MTRLADPAGTPLHSTSAYTSALQFDPTGTYLAQIAYTSSRGAAALHLYRRDGDTLTRLPDPPAAPEGPPLGLWWHPSGQWLVVATIAFTPQTSRLQVYRRDGDTLTWFGRSDPSVYGFFDSMYGTLAFDATGGWIALANSSGQGPTGLASFNAGTITLTSGDTGHSAYGAAWNPTDPAQLVRVDDQGGMQMLRRSGGTLAADGPREVLTSGQVLWHPGGTLMVGNDLFNGATSGPVVYDRTFAFRHFMGAYLQVMTGYAFDASGTWFAGGPAVEPDTSGCGCGGGGGTYLGLTVSECTPVAIAGGPALSSVMLDRMPAADQAAGAWCTFATGTAGTVYLAASGESSGNYGTALPWGLRLYRITKAAPAASSLYMRQPDGSFVLVGTDDQPVSFRLPDGSERTWPGSGYPLYIKQSDGTWKKVLG